MNEEEKTDINTEAQATSYNNAGAPAENVHAKKEMSPLMKKLAGGVITSWFIGYMLMVVGSMVGQLLLQIPLGMMGYLNDDHPVIVTAVTYLGFIGIWAAVFIFIRGFREEWPFLRKIIGRITPAAVLGWILGLVFIGGMNFICILLAKHNGDIFLSFDCFEIAPLIFLFIAVFIQSGAEELICRGFIYRRVEKTYNPIVATVSNALLFALIHVMNPGVTVLSLLNVFLCGIMFSLIIYYTDSMAFAMAGHAGWNFCQSIIFGLPNSGQVFPYSIFKLDASNARDSFFYNVGFGVEGTAFAVIILAVACVVIIVLGQLKIIKRPSNIKPLI